jgi:RNA polymerase sigma-70 factor, ECF subfamily
MHSSEASNKWTETSDKMPQEVIKEWIAGAVAGNRDDQKRIYELLASRIYRVIRKIVGPSNVDDVMQDFVIHFFAKLNQFRFESSLETWAHRMAVNQSLQYLRKCNREAERIRKVGQSKTMTENDPIQNQSDDLELLQLAMERITGEQRAILHMKEVEGMGYDIIATVLGIPEGTVGSRLNKARRDLRTFLVGLGWES